jgi:alkylhydroperoxidase family enzyme
VIERFAAVVGLEPVVRGELVRVAHRAQQELAVDLTAGRLDLDHVGAEVGEQRGRRGRREPVGDLDHADSGERCDHGLISTMLGEEAYMRIDKPRIAALSDDQIDPEVRNTIGGGPMGMLNIFRTLANHPGPDETLARVRQPRARQVDAAGARARDRDPADRWLSRGATSGASTSRSARPRVSPTRRIARIPKGAAAVGWSTADRALLRATDELHADAFISDATWAELASTLSTQQLMDLVFTVGQYNLVSMALNSFGVQPEPGLAPLPRA